MNSVRFLSLVLWPGLALAAPAPEAAPRHAPAPVSVSSANYRELSRAELLRLDVEKNKVNPPSRQMEPAAASQRYVFVPGELYEADLSYEEICRRLTVTLAKKVSSTRATNTAALPNPRTST